MSCAKNRLIQNTLRHPAHHNYLSSDSYYGTNCCQSFSIFIFSSLPHQLCPLKTMQYAFCPTGSTTAALVHLFTQSITHMLTTNPYVIVLCLDFSKAIDIVRHSTLLEKLAQLDMPDNVYNWMGDFFNGHSHRTNTTDRPQHCITMIKSQLASYRDSA